LYLKIQKKYKGYENEGELFLAGNKKPAEAGSMGKGDL